ncbi:MAG: 3-hydroxyacyl-CoA dehydrogenase [Rhizobiaceae bacterium]
MNAGINVAIVGSGLIGCSWAVSFARGGCTVKLFDQSAEASMQALRRVHAVAAELAGAGLLGDATVEDIAARVSVSRDLGEAVEAAAHVQENVSERLEAKMAVFAELDRLAGPQAILASSTSALLPSAFTAHVEGRHRCVVAHPINPPSLIPAVEIVPAPWTDAETVERTTRLMERIGQRPIRMTREIDGFIVNRLQGALLQEAFRLVAAGVASPDDVDAGIRDGLAPRWALVGPFETIDLNAPGGVRDYVARYGGMYETIASGQCRTVGWDGPVLDEIEAARRSVVPLDQIPAAQARRDQRLMALMAHLRSRSPIV